MSECAACKTRGKTWEGSDPKCAFLEGEFGDNWNCASVNAIRDLCDRKLPSYKDGIYVRCCEDQWYAIIDVSHIRLDRFSYALWLTWYKGRGRTEEMWLLGSGIAPRKPTASELVLIAKVYA